MTPILFPFTWLSPALLSVLETVVGRPTVLAPSERGIPAELAKWQEAGRIALEVPIAGDGDRMDRLLKEYRSWADAHRGADISLSRMLEGEIPFFDDSHVSKIRSEIRRGRSRTEDAGGADLRLIRARLFLQMAQEYDRQSREIEQDLASLQAVETAMFSELHEGLPLVGDSRRKPARPAMYDPGRFMTEGRIRAWARLYLAAAPSMTGPAMFVTPSREVLEAVLESAPDPDAVRSAAFSPSEGRRVEALAEILAAGKQTPAAQTPDGPGTAVFFVPECGPRRLFSRFLAVPARETETSRSQDGTVLVLVEMPA